MMKKTWRPAWPHRSNCWGVSNAPPMAVPTKTVNNKTLPTMPTGHAATLRNMPSSALANPNPLPMISRHKMTLAPTWSSAFSNRRSTSWRSIDPSTHPVARMPGWRAHIVGQHLPADEARVNLPSGLSPSVVELHHINPLLEAEGSRTVTAGSDLHRPRYTREFSTRRAHFTPTCQPQWSPGRPWTLASRWWVLVIRGLRRAGRRTHEQPAPVRRHRHCRSPPRLLPRHPPQPPQP